MNVRVIHKISCLLIVCLLVTLSVVYFWRKWKIMNFSMYNVFIWRSGIKCFEYLWKITVFSTATKQVRKIFILRLQLWNFYVQYEKFNGILFVQLTSDVINFSEIIMIKIISIIWSFNLLVYIRNVWKQSPVFLSYFSVISNVQMYIYTYPNPD